MFENTPLDDNKNTRYNAIVKQCVDRGYRVTFWASTFRHNQKVQRFVETTRRTVGSGVEVVYVKSRPYKKNISLSRLFSHYALAKEMGALFDQEEIVPDLIVVAYPPISVAMEAAKWAKERNIPCVVDIIDPWPEVFRAHLKFPFGLGDLFLQPLTSRAKYAMRKARGLMAISSEYLRWAREIAPNVARARYFYPAIDYDEVEKQRLNATVTSGGKSALFTVIYAGSLGYSYDLPTILDAARILEARHGNQIQFVIAGDGPQRPLVEKSAASLSNVRYLGRLSKEQLMLEYFQADVGLTQHIRGATQSVTYKLFDLLSAGLPVLNSLESEMKEIIQKNEVGMHNCPGDVDGLVANILACFQNPALVVKMRENGKKLTLREGAAHKVYSDLVDFLEECAS